MLLALRSEFLPRLTINSFIRRFYRSVSIFDEAHNRNLRSNYLLPGENNTRHKFRKRDHGKLKGRIAAPAGVLESVTDVNTTRARVPLNAPALRSSSLILFVSSASCAPCYSPPMGSKKMSIRLDPSIHNT